MKVIFFLFLSVSSSLAYSQSEINIDSLHYMGVKGREGESMHVRCYEGETVVGFRHRNKGDDCVVGMWCDAAPFTAGNGERFIEVNNFSGVDYDVKCDRNEYMSGVNFKDDIDNSLEGIYCREILDQTLKSEYYISFYDRFSRGSTHDEFCPNGGVASGVRFRESAWDDRTLGFYCRFAD